MAPDKMPSDPNRDQEDGISVPAQLYVVLINKLLLYTTKEPIPGRIARIP